MGEAQHTPTPWSMHIHQGSLFGEAHINGPHHCAIAYVGFGTQTDDHYVRGEEANANARFIVEAVNSHATLTAALEEARGALEGIVNDIHDYERVNNLHPNPGKSECWQSVERARTALATINAALGRVGG